MPSDPIAKIQEMLADFNTAMLITQGHNHLPHCRPMAIARVEAAKAYVTGTTPHIREGEQHGRAVF